MISPSSPTPDSSRSPLETFREMPLVWIAVAATAGVAIDRITPIPLVFSLALAGSCLVAWLFSPRAPILAILAATVAFGAARHHLQFRLIPANDVVHVATADGAAITLRGRLVMPPSRIPGSEDPFVSIPRTEATRLIIDATAIVRSEELAPVTGRVIAFVPGKIEPLYPGDELELRGRLALPRGPSNPGEPSDGQDIRATLSLPDAADAVLLVARRWSFDPTVWLGRLHAACKATLDERLTVEPALAAALLLGDGSGLSRSEWDKFLRSGVVHALAISGQHLVILAVFLSFIRRLFFIRLTPATIGIAGLLFAYALLTGGRPPALRAAWMVLIGCIAILGRRDPVPLNTLAFAWLGILLVNPADLFQTGCQLSFLAVALLQHYANPYIRERNDIVDLPVDIEGLTSSIPSPIKHLWTVLRDVYVFGFIIWLGVTPLIADRFHVVAPIALLIGPLVVFATSVALVAGFLLLLTAPILGPLAAPFAWVTDAALNFCDQVIDIGLQIPGASFNVVNLPAWWTVLFYIGLLLPWVMPRMKRAVWYSAAAVWLALGLALGLGVGRRAEFHVAFLSVGHGGCTVIETSDGRVLVYDAGAITGPELTRRIVLPYLGSRGIRRIDELFISHADLDHFSGVPDLLERISVKRVSLTPSFAQRDTPAVRRVVDEIDLRGIPTRIVQLGDSERAADLHWDVLHPPAVGPAGNENARSLVMLVRKDAFSMLLTGDLEGVGLERLLELRSRQVEVLMAPHHGSRLVSPHPLAAWARPQVVVSSQGRPRGALSPASVYESAGAHYFTTFRDGAIEIGETNGEFELTTFRTKKTIGLGRGRVE